MCRGATDAGPSKRLRAEPGLVSIERDLLSVQPLPDLSKATALEDALAKAQAEAAMWRASFEKAQKMLKSRPDQAKAAQLLPPFSSSQQSVQQPASSWQSLRPEDVWPTLQGDTLGEQPQGSSNKANEVPSVSSGLSWGINGAFGDSDALSLKDIAANLSNLSFPGDNASQGPAGSEVTSPPANTAAFPGAAQSMGPFQSSPGGVPSSQQASKQKRTANGHRWTPTYVSSLPVYNPAVPAATGFPQTRFSPHYAPPQDANESAFGSYVPQGRTGGPVLQHPGVTAVKRLRQQSAKSRNLEAGFSPASIPPWEAATGRRDERKLTLKSDPSSPAPYSGGGTRQCMSPGCARRPSYGVSPGAETENIEGGARWCRAHAAEGMEDLRNLRCTHIGRGGAPCRAQPSYGFEGDKRPSRCRAHAEESMENVRMPRCRHPGGCKRQPLYGLPGTDKKPTRCRSHALPGMKDLRGATCRGGDGMCTKRPSYGLPDDHRPTRCGSHKEPGMQDLISARCKFPGCRTVASYGVQAEGSHVIRRTRCKAHRTPEMTCGTKGPACLFPGGCETRPSYGWPDKFDGEHPPRPERCKKHSLPGMEYMGSAARAKKKRLLQGGAKEEEPPLKAPRRSSPQKAQDPLRATRARPSRKCVIAAAPIIDGNDDGGLEEFVQRPEAINRGWSPESRIPGDQAEESARGWSPESRVPGDEIAESARGWSPESRIPGDQVADSARGWSPESRMQGDEEVGESAQKMMDSTLQEMENLGDLKALQELREIEDQANDQIWGSGRPDSPELAGMSAFDRDFSSDWARPDSPDSGGIMDVDYADTAHS